MPFGPIRYVSMPSATTYPDSMASAERPSTERGDSDAGETTFGDRLRELRTGRDLSQRQLAEQIGTSGPIIGRYERGDASPSIDVVEKLADAFEVSVDYLIGRTDRQLLDSGMLQRIDAIERMEPADRKRLFRVVDALIRDAQARTVYGDSD